MPMAEKGGSFRLHCRSDLCEGEKEGRRFGRKGLRQQQSFKKGLTKGLLEAGCLWEESQISQKWGSWLPEHSHCLRAAHRKCGLNPTSVVGPERQQQGPSVHGAPAAGNLSGAFSRSPQLAVLLLAPTQDRVTLGKALGCQVQALIMQSHCADQMAKCNVST